MDVKSENWLQKGTFFAIFEELYLFEKSMEYPRHVALIPDGNRTRAKEH
jgi:undecaprenyl pyrophosphate synthase